MATGGATQSTQALPSVFQRFRLSLAPAWKSRSLAAGRSFKSVLPSFIISSAIIHRNSTNGNQIVAPASWHHNPQSSRLGSNAKACSRRRRKANCRPTSWQKRKKCSSRARRSFSPTSRSIRRRKVLPASRSSSRKKTNPPGRPNKVNIAWQFSGEPPRRRMGPRSYMQSPRRLPKFLRDSLLPMKSSPRKTQPKRNPKT